MLNMQKQYTILTLKKQGKKNAEIARDLECNRHTVENILKRGVQEIQIRHKPSVVAPYKMLIKEWLDQDITRKRIYDMLKEEHGFTFSYDSVRKFVKKHFPNREAFGVQEHLPGTLQFDFGESRVYFTEEKRWVKLQFQAFVLPFSGMRQYGVEEDQKLETFLNGFTGAFTKYGGVPKKVTIDNLKDGVTVNKRYALEFNQTFLEYSYHYGFIINPCAPYSPEQKGTVEGGVKYVKQNFVAGRSFKSLSDAKDQLKDWTEAINQKIHGTTKKVIREVYETIEKKELSPLPAELFSFFNRCERKVHSNCHINFDNNYYSVPFSYVGEEVTVRWNKSVVRIILRGDEVALHDLCTGQGIFVTKRAHLPADKIYSETEYRLHHETKMKQIGLNGHKYFIMLLEKQPKYWHQTLRPVYGMVSDFGNEAVDKALGRALAYGAIDTRIIRNILEKKLYEIVETVELPEFSDTGNSRDLSYYCVPPEDRYKTVPHEANTLGGEL